MSIELRRFRMMKGLMAVGLALAGFGFSVGAARTDAPGPGIYYLAPNGSDQNDGTLDSPFLSLERAAEVAGPGTTIYLRGGTYAVSRSIQWSVSGLPGEYVRILAYPGETPVLDASVMEATGYYAGWVVDLNEVSWVHLRGIEIKNGTEGGLVIRGASNHNVIEGLNVHHIGRYSLADGKGISLLGPASGNLLLRNDSHHNEDEKGDNADGFSVSVSGFGNILRGNRAWRNSDDGFDFFNIYDNTVGAPLLVEHNYAWENGFNDNLDPIGNGVGFKLGGARPGTTSTSGGHTVRYNLSWNNSAQAFDQNGATTLSELHENRTEPTEAEFAAAFGPPPAW